MGAEAEGSTGGQPRTHALRECGIAAITDHGEDERVGDVERPTDERLDVSQHLRQRLQRPRGGPRVLVRVAADVVDALAAVAEVAPRRDRAEEARDEQRADEEARARADPLPPTCARPSSVDFVSPRSAADCEPGKRARREDSPARSGHPVVRSGESVAHCAMRSSNGCAPSILGRCRRWTSGRDQDEVCSQARKGHFGSHGTVVRTNCTLAERRRARAAVQRRDGDARPRVASPRSRSSARGLRARKEAKARP